MNLAGTILKHSCLIHLSCSKAECVKSLCTRSGSLQTASPRRTALGLAPSRLPCLLKPVPVTDTAQLITKQLPQFKAKSIKGCQHFFQTYKGVFRELPLGLKPHWTVPHHSADIVVFLPAQVHRTLPMRGAKAYFHRFLTINYSGAVEIHMARQNVWSPPHQLPGAMAGSEARLISFCREGKVLVNAERLPNSRELTHQQPTEEAGLPAQACDNTCSSSSSASHSAPFTVIYGALATVGAGGAARTEPYFTPGSWLSLLGEAGGGRGVLGPATGSLHMHDTKEQKPAGADKNK